MNRLIDAYAYWASDHHWQNAAYVVSAVFLSLLVAEHIARAVVGG